jgi:signal transduction histidine kinase
MGQPMSRPSAVALTAAAWGLGIVTTCLLVSSPYVLFGFHNPSLHLVLNSVDACVALLVAYLLLGAFRRSHRLQDELLAQGFLLLALAGLVGMALHLLVPAIGDPRTVDVWLPLGLRVSGALLVLAAAMVGRRIATRRASWWRRPVPAATVVLVAALLLTRDHLPVALSQSAPSPAQRPIVDGHPLLLAAQVLSALCFFVASVAFTRQARSRTGELVRWLGPACALAAFARVNYVLFPSLYSDWLYTGDLLRTASYVVLAVGAAREISRYWAAQAQVAVLDDRRRLARELHDGLVQELVYIRSAAHSLSPERGKLPQQIIGACDTALDEARSAIEALGHRSEEPLGFVLHRAARQVAERYDGRRVVVDLDDSVHADQRQLHALVRITREAVSNALRHGQARSISIRLSRAGTTRRLSIEDDGCGFDAARLSDSTGYGMTSMRERAEALPGCFHVDAVPGRGAIVEVSW